MRSLQTTKSASLWTGLYGERVIAHTVVARIRLGVVKRPTSDLRGNPRRECFARFIHPEMLT